MSQCYRHVSFWEHMLCLYKAKYIDLVKYVPSPHSPLECFSMGISIYINICLSAVEPFPELKGLIVVPIYPIIIRFPYWLKNSWKSSLFWRTQFYFLWKHKITMWVLLYHLLAFWYVSNVTFYLVSKTDHIIAQNIVKIAQEEVETSAYDANAGKSDRYCLVLFPYFIIKLFVVYIQLNCRLWGSPYSIWWRRGGHKPIWHANDLSQ